LSSAGVTGPGPASPDPVRPNAAVPNAAAPKSASTKSASTKSARTGLTRTGGIGLPEDAPGLALARLADMQSAREIALAACRRTIRCAGGAVRAVHTRDPSRWESLLSQSEQSLREAQAALGPFPAVYYAGFLQDAEKEYGEAALTRMLVEGGPLPTWDDLSIGLSPWLNGLCEAASELRREVLDRLREGNPGHAEMLMREMDAVYELLMGIDFPDALTGGLRRSADALRAVLERTRADLTTTALQLRLQASLEGAAGRMSSSPGPRADEHG
jgi:translin